MDIAVAAPLTAPNSPEALALRVRSGQIRWTPVIIICFARLVLALLAQGATALVLRGQGVENAFVQAGDWFTVHGTLIDVGTVALLVLFLQREGLSFWDLFRAGSTASVKRSLLQVPAVLVVLFIAGFATAALTGLAVYGTALSKPPFVPLPLWAGLYSTLVWPLIWGVVEQAAYDGYAAPRIAALSRARWPLVLVCLGWAVQHVALPFRFDAAFWAYRFFPSLAVAICCVVIYLRTRNLLPLVISHVLVDAASGALTLAPA